MLGYQLRKFTRIFPLQNLLFHSQQTSLKMTLQRMRRHLDRLVRSLFHRGLSLLSE